MAVRVAAKALALRMVCQDKRWKEDWVARASELLGPNTEQAARLGLHSEWARGRSHRTSFAFRRKDFVVGRHNARMLTSVVEVGSGEHDLCIRVPVHRIHEA